MRILSATTQLAVTICAAAGAKLAMAAPCCSSSALLETFYPAGANGFFRAPVLLTACTEAILIDGGFTFSDGQAVADTVAATGKTLTAVYISQSDPDYYFSLAPIHKQFPRAAILAANATLAAIQATAQTKINTWLPVYGSNGPQTLADVVFPSPFDGPALALDAIADALRIVDVPALPNRRYIYIPALDAVVGGVLVFSGVHVWIADLPSTALRAAWVDHLNALIASNPSIVVPGHMTPDAPTGVVALQYTRDYLLAFEDARSRAHNSTDLIAEMTKLYPDAQSAVSLTTSAQVVMGEITWP
ncbi:Zn-dependent hydrolase [Zopfochytrium polystomum]|nr:Zn-dependent hydrolase [Zopfochytrium polystomum]